MPRSIFPYVIGRSRILDNVDRHTDVARVGRTPDTVDHMVDRAGAEVDRHNVVQLDARSVGNLEAVLGVNRRVVLVEDVDAATVKLVGLHFVSDLVAGPALDA